MFLQYCIELEAIAKEVAAGTRSPSDLSQLLTADKVLTLLNNMHTALKALDFYAEPYTWARVSADSQHMGASPGFNFNHMYGEIARKALTEIEK